MSVTIEYDVVSHIFFCEGHVKEQDFMEALWEQWETDFCTPVDSGAIRWAYARFVRTNPGYWKEVAHQGRGTKAITVVNGSVVNLGPQHCPSCDAPMALSQRLQDEMSDEERWDCFNCRTKVLIIRPV